MDLSSLDGSNGFRLDGANAVSNAGDINGDGFDDLIVGAPGADPNGSISISGSSYVILGGNFNAAVTHRGLTGTSAAERFVADTGNNTLTLTPLDVLDLSESSNTLTVNGQCGRSCRWSRQR